MRFNMRNPLVIIFGLIILYVLTRNIWLDFGRIIPYIGITEILVIVGIIIVFFTASRVVYFD
ncbi:MAG: hypothetical protein ACTSRK_20665 [Promethearchaeota archaeon]